MASLKDSTEYDGKIMMPDGKTLARAWEFYREGHGWDIAFEGRDLKRLDSINTEPGLPRNRVLQLLAAGASQGTWKLLNGN